METMNFILIALFVTATILLGVYATRTHPVVVQKKQAAASEKVSTDSTASQEPPAGASGFGIGLGIQDLTVKPPMTACSTLNRKPPSAEQASAELQAFFQPAGSVPTEGKPGTIGDCPPMKPMSSASPLADVPMCVLSSGSTI